VFPGRVLGKLVCARRASHDLVRFLGRAPDHGDRQSKRAELERMVVLEHTITLGST